MNNSLLSGSYTRYGFGGIGCDLDCSTKILGLRVKLSRSRAQGKRNWRFDYDLDPSPMYRIEIEPSIKEAISSLRKTDEVYKKWENKHMRLCQKRAKYKKNKNEKKA